MKFVKGLSLIFDCILTFFNVISGGIMIAMMVIIGFSVVLRYFFHNPIGWAQEVSEYSLVIITFFSMAWVLKEEKHVSMDLLTNIVKPLARNLLGLITSAVCIVVCFILAFASAKVAGVEYTLGYTNYTQLAPPKFIFTLLIMIGFILVAIQFIRRAIGFILKLKAGEDTLKAGEDTRERGEVI